MAPGSFRFESFHLDPVDRRLTRNDEPVELNGRYFDALTLLVQEQGRLVSKDRFLEKVWRGVPVTDEALTQCIRTLRRQLGDDAARPRFIETVPKHGYRFVADVEAAGSHRDAAVAQPPAKSEALSLGIWGMLGGGFGGLVGSPIYGSAATASAVPAMGAGSILLVLLCVTLIIALVGGAGVSFGVAVARLASGKVGPWSIVGGALGGLVIGAIVKLIGMDAFHLLLGRGPADITGPGEGALIGAAVGLAAWIALKQQRLRVALAIGAIAGAVAGALAVLLGGHMLGGSLDLLAGAFPESQLRLDAIGSIFGEAGFGRLSQVITAGLEGALFVACVVGGMLLAEERLRSRSA